MVPPMFIVGRVDAIRHINRRSWSYFHRFCSSFDLDHNRGNVLYGCSNPIVELDYLFG